MMKTKFWVNFINIITTGSNIDKFTAFHFILEKVNTCDELTGLKEFIKTNNSLSLPLFQSLYAINYKGYSLSNNQMLIWLDFIKNNKESFSKEAFDYAFRVIEVFLAKAKSERNEHLTSKCGETIRKIYTSSELRHKFKDVITNGVAAIIADTYETEPNETRKIIEELLEEDTRNYRLASGIIDNFNDIASKDFEFASQIYLKSIGFISKDSDSATLKIHKPISGYSNNFDDYLLKKALPAFLNTNNINALEIMFKSLNYFAFNQISAYREKDIDTFTENELVKISLLEKESIFIEDLSHIWGNREENYGYYGITLDVFNYISRIEDNNRIYKIISIFIENSHTAFLWRNLITLITEKINIYKPYVFSILKNPILMIENDTYRPIGLLLKKAIQVDILTLEQRDQVEQIILELPEYSSDEELQEAFELRQKRFIDLIGDKLTKQELKEKYKELKQENINPGAIFEIPEGVQVTSVKMTQARWYKELGVESLNIDEEDLTQEHEYLQKFYSENLNSIPSLKSIELLMPHLIKTHETLKHKQLNINPVIIKDGWIYIAECLSAACRGSHHFANDESLKTQIKDLIDDCLSQPSESYDSKNKTFFSGSEKYSSIEYLNFKTPLNLAVEALVYYYRSISTPEIFAKLKEYASNDYDTSLKWRISQAIFYITPIINKEFFELINISLDKTLIDSIQEQIYYYSLKQILNYPDEVKQILDKLEKDEDIIKYYSDKTFDSTGLLVNLAISHKETWTQDKLNYLISNPIKYSSLVRTIIFSAFNNLNIDENLKEFSELMNTLFTNIKSQNSNEGFSYEELNDWINMFLIKFKFSAEGKSKEKENKEKIFFTLKPSIDVITELLLNEDYLESNSKNIGFLIKNFNKVLNATNFNDLIYKSSKLSTLLPKIYDIKGFYDFETVENFINICDQAYNQYVEKLIEDKNILNNFKTIVNNLLETGNPKAIQFTWSLEV